MSSEDVPSPSQPKPSTSSFADVFKTLGVGRPKSQSPISSQDNSLHSPSLATEGRRGSRVTFGFESMQQQRGSLVSNSSDTSSGPDLDASFRAIAQQNLPLAIDEAENLSRSIQRFTSEQSISLWETGAYLLRGSTPEARRAGSKLLEAVAARQDLSPVAKRVVFEAIASPSEPDVIPARILSLISLSDHGRKLEFTGSSVLPIVSSCLVPLYESISLARSRARKGKVPKMGSLNEDEANFAELFQFAVDLITLQRWPPSGEEIESLLEQVFIVCKRTVVASDIKNSLAVFDAVILYADVPDGSFVPLLEVFCSIHASVRSLSGPTSRAVRNLARSRKQTQMVNTLHSFLLNFFSEQGRNLNVLRGAIYIFTDLVRAHGQDGMPPLAFEQLIDSLEVVAKKDDGRIEADILELCLSALEGEFSNISLGKDWSKFVGILITCSRRIIVEPDLPSSTPSPLPPHPMSRTTALDDTKSHILANVVRIAGVIETLWEQLERQQRLEAGRFLMEVSQHIEPSQADLVINLIRAEKLCYPEKLEWVSCCQKLIFSFLRSRTKASDIRILALDTLKEAFTNYEPFVLFQEKGLINLMLQNFSDEDDLLYLESLVSFIVEVSILTKDKTTFTFLVDTLCSPMNKDLNRDESQYPDSPLQTSPRRQSAASVLELSLANVCSVGLVKIFLRSLNLSAYKAALVFEALMYIARSLDRHTDSRLTVLKLLFRLRCDSTGSITVISPTENDFLVSVLGRTVDTGSRQTPFEDYSECQWQSTPAVRLLGKEQPASFLSRSASRGSSFNIRQSKVTPPVWAYGSSHVLPEEPPSNASPFVSAYLTSVVPNQGEPDSLHKVALKINLWLETIILLLQRERDWDVYSYILTHLGDQLSNRAFFSAAIPQIKLLRSVLCDQVKNETFHEPPVWTGVKKTDVAVCIFDSLSMLISYHEHFAKSEEDELVRAFMLGIIGSWGGTTRGCIHALSVCCHEIPLSVTKSLNGILDKMAKVITMANMAVHILEFLALLARLPDVYVNLREEEIRTVFGICIRFLQTSREQRVKASEVGSTRNLPTATRNSATAAASVELPDSFVQDAMSRYVYTLTHHVMIFWFLSLKLQDRPKHVNWITSRLIFDENGKDMVEEQSQVFIDFMQRVAFSDLGDTVPFDTFPPTPGDGPVSKKSWLVGMSIVTVETAGVSGLTQITKRQASGTTYAMYQQRTAPLLPHQVPPAPDAHLHPDAMRTAILPSHVMLQLSTTAFPTPTVMQPIPLPDNDMIRRAIGAFDRNDIVDGHKIGVIYIDKGQTTEAEILANAAGSPDYEYFLSGLGTKVPLKGARFNTQGLHSDIDGEYAYAWRDRVTEIVYHVVTMMPTDLERDPACINKKRHIGNDFVNIIFNRSNLPFQFDTIPSQFNFVNIVISPVCRLAYEESGAVEWGTSNFENLYYHVKVMNKPGFPEISPAAVSKVISGKNLPAFIRILALNASVFSLVWNSQDGEHISSWRNRLREIKRLRERTLGLQYQNSDATAEGTSYPAYRRNTKPNIHSEEATSRGSVVAPDSASEWNAAAGGNALSGLDFSRWSR